MPLSERLATLLLEEYGHEREFEVSLVPQDDAEAVKAAFIKLGCRISQEKGPLRFTVVCPERTSSNSDSVTGR
jgi:hypothetical protein